MVKLSDETQEESLFTTVTDKVTDVNITINNSQDYTVIGLKTINAATTGDITLSDKDVALSGISSDLLDAFDDGFDTGYFGNVTITNSNYIVSQLVNINAATTGSTTLSDVTVALSGSSSDLLDAFAGTFTSNHSGNITITDSASSTVTAANLKTIGTRNHGTVEVLNAINITGSKSDCTAALITEATKVDLLEQDDDSTSTVTVSDTVSVSEGYALATVANATVNFPNAGITDSLSNLVSSGELTSNLSYIISANDNNPTIYINNSGDTLLASDISAFSESEIYSGLALITNGNIVSGTASDITNIINFFSGAGKTNTTIKVTDSTTVSSGSNIVINQNYWNTVEFIGGINDSFYNMVQSSDETQEDSSFTIVTNKDTDVNITINSDDYTVIGLKTINAANCRCHYFK